MVQLDTEGCTCAIINKESIVKESVDNIKSGYLTLRYYNKYRETKLNAYKNLYMYQVMMGSSAEESGNYSSLMGSKVVWHAEEKLPDKLYQDYTITLNFTVRPEAVYGEADKVVRYVDVTVTVNDAEGPVYQKERRVELQNNVYYVEGNTMYSDGPGS